MNEIIGAGLSAALLVKIIVDLFRMAITPERWTLPALALVVGVVICLLFRLAERQSMDDAGVAQAVLAGLFAGAAAMGATGLHNRARDGELVPPSITIVQQTPRKEGPL